MSLAQPDEGERCTGGDRPFPNDAAPPPAPADDGVLQVEAAPAPEVPSASADPDNRNLYVANLPLDFTEELLAAMMANFGELESTCLFSKRRINTRQGGAYGFAQFRQRADAERAVAALDLMDIDGRVLKVQFSDPSVIVTGPPAAPQAAASAAPTPTPSRKQKPSQQGVNGKAAQLAAADPAATAAVNPTSSLRPSARPFVPIKMGERSNASPTHLATLSRQPAAFGGVAPIVPSYPATHGPVTPMITTGVPPPTYVPGGMAFAAPPYGTMMPTAAGGMMMMVPMMHMVPMPAYPAAGPPFHAPPIPMGTFVQSTTGLEHLPVPFAAAAPVPPPPPPPYHRPPPPPPPPG